MAAYGRLGAGGVSPADFWHVLYQLKRFLRNMLTPLNFTERREHSRCRIYLPGTAGAVSGRKQL
jgi:hypothetical protein